MKQMIKPALLCAGLLPAIAGAQTVDVNRDLYPDYSTTFNPDFSLLEQHSLKSSKVVRAAETDALPDHFNNADFKHFPPVFNQDGGSCGSASRICYMFTHEINSYRDLDAQSLSNRYPSHFVWLLTYGNSGKDEFVQYVGVPSAEIYGGTTYSALFGNQEEKSNDFGWMTGYEKWYAGMWNRMHRPAHIPISVETEEGRQAVKRWLYNHNGDTDFHSGGLAGIGVASGGDWQKIPYTPTNKEIGVNGKYYVNSWGKQVDHALTIVGYDDRIEFDLDGNGKKGEKDKDEVGAWIIVNSWGGWCNDGFIYCPYAYATPVGKGEGGFWAPEIYKVRKDYRPLRTIKIKMEYSHRSEMYLSAGVSTNLEADEPEKSIAFEHFKYAGDGKNGNTNPAPAIPMLGRWADGQLHNEPMEFGYDLTDLSAGFDKNMPLKYFFIIETRSWGIGEGKIHNASIIDYEFDKLGIETPFNIGKEGVKVTSKGKKTIISCVVYGESYFAPSNLSLVANKLSWSAPLTSSHKLKSYKVYRNGMTLAEMAPEKLAYTLTEDVADATYSVAALYEDGVESAKINVNTPVTIPAVNKITNFKNSGFSVPNVFAKKFEEATIEFWIKPNSLHNYNQTIGPGWGTFMFHANNGGALTVGWDTRNRIDMKGHLTVNKWSHVAISVKKNKMELFIDGFPKGSITSSNYSGLGGFGNLVFQAGGGNSFDGSIDELRIWNRASIQSDLLGRKKVEYSGNILPDGLVAYFKGDVIDMNGKKMFRECVSGNHAEILNNDFVPGTDASLKFNTKEGKMNLTIVEPKGDIFVGQPISVSANYSGLNNLLWTAEGAGVKDLQVVSPTLNFTKTGKQNIYVVGSNADGETVKDTCTVNVLAAPAPDASFTPTSEKISAGERVTFIVNNPVVGYRYEWSMPGGETEKANSTNCATSYAEKGSYKVTLTVTTPTGEKASKTQEITVVEVAPEANFDVAPTTVMKGETTFLKDKSKYTPISWQWLIQGQGKDVIINGQNSSYTPDAPGVYNVTLTATNSTGSDSYTRERGLVVCNADSKNGLNFSYNNAQVSLTKVPFETNGHYATIEWWMKPNTLNPVCCGFGEEGTFVFKTTTDGSTTLHVAGEKYSTPSGYVVANEWHHYAITFSNGYVRFLKDGKTFNSQRVKGSKFPAMKAFHISGADAPISGQIDEFRIWNKALTEAQLKTYINQPIADIAKAVAEDKLAVYYNFNQNSGNVKDLTGNGNDGIRKNFGPEGDAWGLSKGVFSLNFDAATAEDITSKYLKNYKKAFKTTNQSVNNGKTRFMAIDEWTLENAKTAEGITTAVHVDKSKNSCFTFTSGWDDFGTFNDHKAYQTFTLPAGSYTFTAKYGEYEGNCGDSYLVAAVGKGLPSTLELGKAIGYSAMKSRSKDVNANSLHFVLAEETEISLGLLINMGGKSCCTISEFTLTNSELEILDADDANGFDLQVDGTGYSSLFLPYPTLVPENVTAYVANRIENDAVVISPIEDGIVPAKTGVIIKAEAGKYHFEPSTTGSSKTSILVGVLKETDAAADKRYYSFDALDQPSFVLYNKSTLEANKAYLVTDASDTHSSYDVTFVATGIESIKGETAEGVVYDLSGRRVNQPVKGVYIANGKKVLVK